MKRFLIVLLILVISITSCRTQEKNQNSKEENHVQQHDALQPAWLKDRMDDWEAEGYTEVSAYRWQGDTVFLAIPPCCDRFSELYNHAGNLVCHPSGGITGKGDGKCPEFRTEAKLIKELTDDQNK